MKRCFVKPIHFLIFFFNIFLVCQIPGISLAYQSKHKEYVFFEHTQYPLRVHYITGEQPGPTIMIQGGIQGDEDAGFITGEILCRTKVLKGNLIVVPRADVPSINIHQRSFNVDLNRRFDKDYDQYFEDSLARVIRFLIDKCDGFIHLHEGSGFYNPTYVDRLRGPHRYGQSVIIDTDVFDKTLFLGNMANKVLAKVNKNIVPKKWSFKLFNTKTFSSSTKYPEQQKSLSFYALKHLKIPALAVEVSKDIKDLDWKVRRQLEIVGGFLEALGVKCILPDIGQDDITTWYASLPSLYLNKKYFAKEPVVLQPYTPFTLSSSSRNTIDHEYAVYIAGKKEYNLLRSEYLPLTPFKYLEVFVDGKRGKKIPVSWQGAWPKSGITNNSLWIYSLNDTIYYTPSGSAIDVFEGDQLILKGIWHGKKNEVLNIKGFVAERGKNTGQDVDIPLMIGKSRFISRYLQGEKGKYWQFRVVRETPGVRKEFISFRVFPHRIKAVEIIDEHAVPTIIPAISDTVHIASGTYGINDIWTQRPGDSLMVLVDEWPLQKGEEMVWKKDEWHNIGIYGARDFKHLHSIKIHVSK